MVGEPFQKHDISFISSWRSLALVRDPEATPQRNIPWPPLIQNLTGKMTLRLRIEEDMSLEDILHSRTDPVHQDIQQLRGRVFDGIFMEWSSRPRSTLEWTPNC